MFLYRCSRAGNMECGLKLFAAGFIVEDQTAVHDQPGLIGKLMHEQYKTPAQNISLSHVSHQGIQAYLFSSDLM